MKTGLANISPVSNSLFTVLFANVFLSFVACSVVRDLCRSEWRKN